MSKEYKFVWKNTRNMSKDELIEYYYLHKSSNKPKTISYSTYRFVVILAAICGFIIGYTL